MESIYNVQGKFSISPIFSGQISELCRSDFTLEKSRSFDDFDNSCLRGVIFVDSSLPRVAI